MLSLVTLLLAGAAAAAPGDTVGQTVQKGINYLTPDAVHFASTSTCQACHRQGAALFGLSRARAAGYTVNTSDSNGVGYLATDAVREQSSNGSWGSRTGSSYTFFGLAAYDQAVSTRYSQQLVRAAEWALTQQHGSGAWLEDQGSFPTTYGHTAVTARMMIGIAQAKNRVDPANAARYADSLTRAANWIRANRANTDITIMAFNFSLAYSLLGLEAAGARSDDTDVVFIRNRLMGGLSRSTGRGWGYTVNHVADEYNTGLVLYALCRSGVSLRDDTRLKDAALWLRDRQNSSGYWSNGSFSSVDIPTTFALLGLSCFGELGVSVRVQGADRQELEARWAEPQTRTFQFTVRNEGAFDFVDSYTLSVQGGLPGWGTTLEPTSVRLPSGQSATVRLTITTPTNLPPALPVQFTVAARSQANGGVTASATVTAYTNPPPPVTGQATAPSFVEGNGASVANRLRAQPLSARVRNTVTNQFISGPGRGVVTFYVAGVAVGTDDDVDGDGIFRVNWVPGRPWSAYGPQDMRAIYSGIDMPAPQPDLLSSLLAGSITIQPDADGDGLSDDLERSIGTNPLNPDTDGDGLDDGSEVTIIGTNPRNRDTDGDGFYDGEEVSEGTNPLDPNSFPIRPPQVVVSRPAPGSEFPPDSSAPGANDCTTVIEGTIGRYPATVEIINGGRVVATFPVPGGRSGCSTTCGSWSYRLPLGVGGHSLTVRASNSAGTSTSTRIDVIVRPNAPALVSVPPSIVNGSQPSLGWDLDTFPGAEVDVTIEDPINGGGEVPVTTEPADGSGRVRVVIPRPADCIPHICFYARPPGQPHRGPRVCRPVYTDSQPPRLTCPAPVDQPYSNGTLTLTASADDSGSHVPDNVLSYEWQVTYADGTTAQASGSPRFTSAFGPGLHTARVTVRDRAGNSATCTTPVHIRPRPTTCTLQDVRAPFGTTINLSGTVSDTALGSPLGADVHGQVRYFINGQLVANPLSYLVTLAPGSHTLRMEYPGSTRHAACEHTTNLVVPVWQDTSRLEGYHTKALHQAVLLPNGKVLAVGGYNTNVDVYDPATGTWSATGSLSRARRYHTATLLKSGLVLVAGGADGRADATAELYDYTTGTWRSTGRMSVARRYHTATLLPDGRVLVAGGEGSAAATAELYDPATGTWALTGPMSLGRYQHTATQLANGHVLVAGGLDTQGRRQGSAELYDPATARWRSVGSMSTGRSYHTATRLPDGRVLVAGGGGDSAQNASAELYNPATGLWTPTGRMARPRRFHTATLLPIGQVLLTGGYDGSTGIHTSTELYNPATGTWTQVVSMRTERYHHAAVLLLDGRVLVIGGFSNGDQGSAELL